MSLLLEYAVTFSSLVLSLHSYYSIERKSYIHFYFEDCTDSHGWFYTNNIPPTSRFPYVAIKNSPPRKAGGI